MEGSPNTSLRARAFRGYADYMLTPAFAGGLEEVVRLVARERPALMCAEAVPWRCHRWLVADALVARGVRVEHVVGGARSVHELSPAARVGGGRVACPGEPALPL